MCKICNFSYPCSQFDDYRLGTSFVFEGQIYVYLPEWVERFGWFTSVRGLHIPSHERVYGLLYCANCNIGGKDVATSGDYIVSLGVWWITPLSYSLRHLRVD